MNMRPATQYEHTVTVTCTDNDNSTTAEILSFVPGQRLIVSLNRAVRLEMVYNSKNQLYMAHQSGLEFISKGPKANETREAKRR